MGLEMEEDVFPLDIFDAARAGDADALRMAMALPGLDPLARTYLGSTALMQAVIAESMQCLDLLLPISQIDAQDKFGDTALSIAVMMGLDEMAMRLLPLAEPNIQGENGRTALMAAVCNPHGDFSLIEELARMSDHCKKNSYGETAAAQAVVIFDQKLAGSVFDELAPCVDLLLLDAKAMRLDQIARAAGHADLAARIASMIESKDLMQTPAGAARLKARHL